MSARPRTFEFRVSLDEAWDAVNDRGGTTLTGSERDQWTPEHLVLAGLARCLLTSLAYHCDRAGLVCTSAAEARGTVSWREDDSRFAFVEIEARAEVTLTPEPDDDATSVLLEKAERDCFVGASLTASPAYRWHVNGRDR